METTVNTASNSTNPYTNLWCEVIERAIKDLQIRDDYERASAKKFFREKNCKLDWICDHLNLDAGAIRKGVGGLI